MFYVTFQDGGPREFQIQEVVKLNSKWLGVSPVNVTTDKGSTKVLMRSQVIFSRGSFNIYISSPGPPLFFLLSLSSPTPFLSPSTGILVHLLASSTIVSLDSRKLEVWVITNHTQV